MTIGRAASAGLRVVCWVGAGASLALGMGVGVGIGVGWGGGDDKVQTAAGRQSRPTLRACQHQLSSRRRATMPESSYFLVKNQFLAL